MVLQQPSNVQRCRAIAPSLKSALYSVTRPSRTTPAAKASVRVRRGDVTTHRRASGRGRSSLRIGGVIGLLLGHEPEDLCRGWYVSMPAVLSLAFIFSFGRLKLGLIFLATLR